MNINLIINIKVNGRMIKETDKGNSKNITLFIKMVYLFQFVIFIKINLHKYNKKNYQYNQMVNGSTMLNNESLD